MPNKKPRASRPTGHRHADGEVGASLDAHAASLAPAKDWYATVAEAATLLRVCTKTVRNRIRSRELEAYRHGRRVLIRRTAIEHLIRRTRL
jgi:excisionase family DNA binding protein